MKIEKKLLICFCSLLLLMGCSRRQFTPEEFQKYSAKQILAGGEEALEKGDYHAAVKYFEAIDALYPFEPEAQQSQRNIIFAYYKSDDFASALAAANRYIRLYPEGKNTDYAYYMKGVVNFDKDRGVLQKLYPRKQEYLDVSGLKEAFASFKELLKVFPNSVYAKDGEKRMYYIRNLLAENELYIADFYLQRKAYVAASNRASYILKHFKGSPQIKDALKIMIESYQALGLKKQSQDAVRIFRLNYPNEKI